MIKKLLDIKALNPLSPAEIVELSKKYFNSPVRIVLYEDIINNKASINDIFDNLDGVIIYYPNRTMGGDRTYGHYVALTRNPETKTIYFFDSYGKKPDVGQKPDTDYDVLYKGENGINTLIKFLLDAHNNGGYKIDYNDKDVQSLSDGTATCGRWALLRAQYPHISNDKFIEFIKSTSKKHHLKPDYLISYLIY